MCPHAQIHQEEVTADRRIRCVLVHDHVLLRQGVRRLLEDEPDLEVVAEAENAAEGLQQVEEQRPEIVITDARVFACAAERAEEMIAEKSPLSKVVFLADDGEAGRGCVAQKTSAEELAEMVRRAHRGATVEEKPRERREWVVKGTRRGGLTARENEVLKLLAAGETVRSAASVLGLSAKTVDAHKFNLMRKLGVHNKAELVMWAIRERVVKVPVN